MVIKCVYNTKIVYDKIEAYDYNVKFRKTNYDNKYIYIMYSKNNGKWILGLMTIAMLTH